MRAQLDVLRAKRQEVNRLAAAPEPDRAAIDVALAEVRREAEAMRAEVHRATFDALLALPPETRARLAEPPKQR
jgi:Spy/CpxP family protein refolding chaperone